MSAMLVMGYFLCSIAYASFAIEPAVGCVQDVDTGLHLRGERGWRHDDHTSHLRLGTGYTMTVAHLPVELLCRSCRHTRLVWYLKLAKFAVNIAINVTRQDPIMLTVHIPNRPLNSLKANSQAFLYPHLYWNLLGPYASSINYCKPPSQEETQPPYSTPY